MYGVRCQRTLFIGLLVASLLGGGAGCGRPEKILVESSAIEAERGLLWMFPGLVGMPGELEPAYRGLRDAGLEREVRIFEWEGVAGDFMKHLLEHETNRRQAAEVAAEVVAYRELHPGASIDFVGYSAGGAIAAFVAEALPEDIGLRNVVMAQPALSPTYDLTEAMQRVAGELIVFYSPRDSFLAGWFCATFGTMDGQLVESAGRYGFDLQLAVPDRGQRVQVQMIGWNEDMERVGHAGNHLAILQYQWNKYIVAPYLVEPENLRAILPPAPNDIGPSINLR